MRTDLKNRTIVGTSLHAALQAAEVDGDGVDLANFDAAFVVIDVGALFDPDNEITFEIQDSDDDDTYTVVAPEFLDGAIGTAGVVDAASQTIVVGYHGIARYLRVSITDLDGTTPKVTCSAIVVAGKSRSNPPVV